MGPVRVFQTGRFQAERRKVNNVEQEVMRVQQAGKLAVAQLEQLRMRALREVGAKGAAIPEAHKLLLEDAYLSDEMPTEFPIPEGKYVDEFGQWTGRDWPGKIHTEEELRESLLALRQNGKPLATRTKWGGEAARKLCEGKGFFKTLKTPDGRWHLVDPDGYDFYSLGVDCIRPGDNPRIDQYPTLCELPPEPWASACGDERFIRYTEANLRRVYGEDWKAAFREISENVLLEGGWNTVANWSDEIFRTGEKRLPYVWQPDIFPTTELKIFRDFPDVLSEEYQKDAIRRAEALREAKDDP